MSFANLVADKTNFTPSLNIKNFISSAYNQNEVRPELVVDLAANVTSGATSLTVATGGFDESLYEGTVIACKTDWTGVDFGEAYFTKYFVVSEFTEADATTIPVYGTTQTATSGDELRIVAWIPLFSAKSHNITDTPNIISDNVFSDGAYMQKAQIGADASATISGVYIYNDPGLLEIDSNRGSGKVFTVMRVLPLLRGGKVYQGFNSDFSDTAERDTFMQQTINFAVTGKPYSLPVLTAA